MYIKYVPWDWEILPLKNSLWGKLTVQMLENADWNIIGQTCCMSGQKLLAHQRGRLFFHSKKELSNTDNHLEKW